MEQFSPWQREMMLQHIAKFAVPLVQEVQGASTCGTASVLAVNGHHYLITAGHVLKELKEYPDGIGVPLGKSRAEAWTFGDGLHVMPVDYERFDFGVFRIDSPELTALIGQHWRIIVPDDLGALSDNVERFVFAGYPTARSYSMGSHVESGLLSLFAPRYQKATFDEVNRNKHSSVIPVDPTVDILVEYPDSFTGANGQQIASIELAGISGSPVWAVRPDPMRLLVESPHQRLQLVGIETSIKVGDYVRAKRWNLIATAFKQIDVSAAEEIERCLAR